MLDTFLSEDYNLTSSELMSSKTGELLIVQCS